MNLLEYKCNYFLGNDQSKWRTDVPNYTSVTYQEVYPGIDLKYYGDGRQMEYDFIVPPGADYSQIKVQYEGAKSLTVNASGDLVIETAWGYVTEKVPIIYQLDGANRVAITGTYRVADNRSFGFSLGPEYDRSLPVVIDPVLSYSTYLGGASEDVGHGIAVDLVGSAYVTGITQSSDFPTASPFDGSYSDLGDAFVTKVSKGYICGDADGSSIVTISDAVLLINYIFSGGPAPDPLLSGDADCSGGVTSSDAAYLISYIFSGGEAPCAVCP